LYVGLLYVCRNFKKTFITLHLWKTVVCICVVQFMLDKLCSTLYMPSTSVAPWRWLQFTVETSSRNNQSCSQLDSNLCKVSIISAQRASHKVPAALHTNEVLQTEHFNICQPVQQVSVQLPIIRH